MALPGFASSRQVVGEAHYALWEAGTGDPVLLLHGFPETHACWWSVAPALTASWRVVAPDLRGYGASVAPAGGLHGIGQHAEAGRYSLKAFAIWVGIGGAQWTL